MSLAATSSRVAVRLPTLARVARKSGTRAVTTTRASSAETQQQQQQQQQQEQSIQTQGPTMRSMARRRPLGGLMGVSPFGLSSSPLADINYEFNRMLPLVDSMMNDVAALSSAVFGHPDSVGSFPAKLAFPCDVLEKKREFLITADLPGLSKDVVNVTVDDERRLHITAERAERHEEKVGEDDEDVKMHVYERTYGKVERMFKLPENVEDEKIEADMKNGVLSVHIPKQPEPAKEQIPERAIKIK